ncbi:hypothetical protein N7517_001968 [Penicillium concentricum]|uniref:Uncharacterized protein n=1 Tax=Penicillium concentricum TaxID=293559 RepID=A0A9W9VJC7_9EURO|nr:uncharacterized protein N7517_001968 [Penicillium concentricum]KAJ5384057.1 hypothetical protein N7517_001968 [Penicillium concentricum]
MPELSRQPKRMSRLWFRSSVRRSDQSSLSGPPGQTKQVYRSVLRRLTRRPPLNKTRSLFVIPTNMKSDGSYMMPRFIPPDELDKPAVPSDSDKWRSFMSRSDTAGFMGEGRHRRCHSEQLRAWRKPSASLWTLQESEE